MMWRRGKILSLGKTWRGAREAEVELEDGSRARALAYPDLVGEPAAGDTVLLQASAAARGLGTGGYFFVCAIPERLPADSPTPGHIVKARYTPLQYLTLGVDEQNSPYHELLREADTIAGMPVVAADLHSALPAIVAGVRARVPGARIAYVMDDGGALPAWFSRTAAQLEELGLILGTISCGQAFGGKLEAVTIYTALLAARLVWRADVAVMAQGPGNLGTDTRWGFSGTRVGEHLNAADTLGGIPIAALRMSSADRRERHLGLSHHSVTALRRVARCRVSCPVPVLGEDALSRAVPAEVGARLAGQLGELFQAPHLERVDVEADAVARALADFPVRLSTMGRSLTEDPLNFLAAGAAGYAAGELVTRARAGAF